MIRILLGARFELDELELLNRILRCYAHFKSDQVASSRSIDSLLQLISTRRSRLNSFFKPHENEATRVLKAQILVGYRVTYIRLPSQSKLRIRNLHNRIIWTHSFQTRQRTDSREIRSGKQEIRFEPALADRLADLRIRRITIRRHLILSRDDIEVVSIKTKYKQPCYQNIPISFCKINLKGIN